MVVERGSSVRHNTLGVGIMVTAKAQVFGVEYAKELFGSQSMSVDRAPSMRCIYDPRAQFDDHVSLYMY